MSIVPLIGLISSCELFYCLVCQFVNHCNTNDFFLWDFILKKTLFEKLQYLKCIITLIGTFARSMKGLKMSLYPHCPLPQIYYRVPIIYNIPITLVF